MNSNDIRDAILLYKIKHGYTNAEFAKMLGISLRSWYYFKNSNQDVFSLIFRKIFNRFDLSYKLYDKKTHKEIILP